MLNRMLNSSYASNSNLARQVNSLNATHVRANLVDTSKLHVAGIRSNVVTGYLPSDFTTGSAALNSIEGALSATLNNIETNPNVLSLPAGAIVTKVIVQKMGGANITELTNIGYNSYTTDPAFVNSSQFFNLLSATDLNSGRVIVNEGTAFGSSGSARLILPSDSRQYVSVSGNEFTNVNFIVKIYYE